MAARPSSSPSRLLLRALTRAGTSVYFDVLSNALACTSIRPCSHHDGTSTLVQQPTSNRQQHHPLCKLPTASDLVLADVVLYDIVSKGVITLAPHQLTQQGGVGFVVACVDAEGGLWYQDPAGVLQYADCPKPGGNSWGLGAPAGRARCWLWACDAAGQAVQSWELPCSDVHQGRAGLKALAAALVAAAPSPAGPRAAHWPPIVLAKQQQHHQAARARSMQETGGSSSRSTNGGSSKPPRVLLVEVYAGTQPMLQAATTPSSTIASSSSSTRPLVELAGVCIVEMDGEQHSPAAICAGIPALWLLGADMTHPSTLDALQRWAATQLATTAVDVVLLAGGPPCNAYSQLNWAATEQQLAQADRRVAALRLADTLLRGLAAAAGVAFRVVVENPHSNCHRALRSRAVMQQYVGSVPGLTMTLQHYCQWSVACPNKPTDIWTDIAGLQPRLCTSATRCQQLGNGRKHSVQLVNLPAGPERAAWPLSLARHLLGCLAAEIGGHPAPPFPPPDDHQPSRKRKAATAAAAAGGSAAAEDSAAAEGSAAAEDSAAAGGSAAADGRAGAGGRAAGRNWSSSSSGVVVLSSGGTSTSSLAIPATEPGMPAAGGRSSSEEVTTPVTAAVAATIAAAAAGRRRLDNADSRVASAVEKRPRPFRSAAIELLPNSVQGRGRPSGDTGGGLAATAKRPPPPATALAAAIKAAAAAGVAAVVAAQGGRTAPPKGAMISGVLRVAAAPAPPPVVATVAGKVAAPALPAQQGRSQRAAAPPAAHVEAAGVRPRAAAQLAPVHPLAAAGATTRDSVSSLSSRDSVSSLSSSSGDSVSSGPAGTDAASRHASSRQSDSSAPTPSYSVRSLTASGSLKQPLQNDSDSDLEDLSSSESEAESPNNHFASPTAVQRAPKRVTSAVRHVCRH